MRAYVARRLLETIPLLLGVTALTFLLLQWAPGDFLHQVAENPAVSQETLDAMRVRFGLDRPWYEQFVLYLRNVVLHLDFGESFSHHRPVFAVLREGVANTLILALTAAAVTWTLAIPLGILAAVRQHRPLDRGLSLLSFVGLSVPEVLSGLLLLSLAVNTGWFPPGGMRSVDHQHLDAAGRLLDIAHHLVLPALVVGLVPLAGRMRQMRSSLLDVLHLDHITTARAKGLPESAVILKHATRTALNPMITLFGLTLGALLSGSFVAEVIFTWPGLGRIAFDALLQQDPYLVMGAVLMSSVVLVTGNLIADVLLAAFDPRVRDHLAR